MAKTTGIVNVPAMIRGREGNALAKGCIDDSKNSEYPGGKKAVGSPPG